MSLETENVLAEKLERLPAAPGVYLMKDHRGVIIYIGKAVNLRNRVRSYFNAGVQNHLASAVLREKAADMDWILAGNEVEALILEANLVRKHSPRYNIELKDDKHYPYLRVTTSEPFPRILVTRKVSPRSGDLFFGPYTNVRAMRQTMRLLRKIFRIRDCDLKLPLDKPITPCLTYHIKRCDAPCANLINTREYGELVKQAEMLLKGKAKELFTRLESQMKEAAASREFEMAATIRDQIRNLEATLEKQRMDLGDDQVPKDLIAVAREGRLAAVVVLRIRDGYVSDRKQFEMTAPLEQDEVALITAFLRKFYVQMRDVPREILLSHPVDEQDDPTPDLCALREAAVSVHVPQRGEKLKQVRLAGENAKMILAEYIARRERKNRLDFRVLSLQEDLHLPSPPKRIEGYDISHLHGTDTVASLVVFEDGKPLKRDYRHFNVKTVEGIDDFASMREVVGRRMKRLVQENKPLPDLILIDGGKGQLSSAYEVLQSQGLENQPIIGLAKRLEEIFFPGQSDPLLLPRSSASLRLLQQVRDESHRFAVTFQRSKRKRYLKQSWLDSVKGVGEKRKMKLLQHFGSPAAIKNATGEQLAEVVGPSVAEKLKEEIQKIPEEEK